MGYSITQATADRIDRNRAEGRECQMGGRCSTRATFEHLDRADGTDREEGEVIRMVFCKRHHDSLMRTLEAHGITVQGYTHVSHGKF